jgi:hypothetical protein
VDDYRVKLAEVEGPLNNINAAKASVDQFKTGLTTEMLELPLDRVMSQLGMSEGDISIMADRLQLIRGQIAGGKLAQEYKDRAQVFNVGRPTAEVLGALDFLGGPLQAKADVFHNNLREFESRHGGGASAGGSPLEKARQAIAAGAPRDAVIQRLRDAGISTEGL